LVQDQKFISDKNYSALVFGSGYALVTMILRSGEAKKYHANALERNTSYIHVE